MENYRLYSNGVAITPYFSTNGKQNGHTYNIVYMNNDPTWSQSWFPNVKTYNLTAIGNMDFSGNSTYYSYSPTSTFDLYINMGPNWPAWGGAWEYTTHGTGCILNNYVINYSKIFSLTQYESDIQEYVSGDTVRFWFKKEWQFPLYNYKGDALNA